MAIQDRSIEYNIVSKWNIYYRKLCVHFLCFSSPNTRGRLIVPRTATVLPNPTNGQETFARLLLFKPNLLYTLRVRRLTKLPVSTRTHLKLYLFSQTLITNGSLCNVSITLSFGLNFTSFLIHGSCSTDITSSKVYLFFLLQFLRFPCNHMYDTNGFIFIRVFRYSYLRFWSIIFFVFFGKLSKGAILISLLISSFNYLHSLVMCTWSS